MKKFLFLSFQKVIFTIASILLLANHLFSQNSLFLKYPLNMSPVDFIPSPSHAVGLMQYAYEDPLRDLFITPGKNSSTFKATGFFSYQFLANDYSYKVYGYPPYFENYDKIFHKNHFPFGVVLNLYGITFGFLYGYGTNPDEEIDSYDNGSGVQKDELIKKGENKFYNLSLSTNLFSSLRLGISYANHNFKNEYNSGINDYKLKDFIPTELIIGMSYNFSEKLNGYFAYGKYSIKREEHRVSNSSYRKLLYDWDYNGNLFNLDLKYKYREDFDLFFRAAYDSRDISWKEQYIILQTQTSYNRYQEGNSRDYKIGVGAHIKVDWANLFSEFNYEPGYYNLQYVTNAVLWDPPISGNEKYFYNWNFGLGIEIQPLDFLKLQLGSRYFKSKVKLIQETDLRNYSTYDPYLNKGVNVVTAGMEINFFNFVLNYVFNYSSYTGTFSPALSPFLAPRFTEYNPVEHKFLLRYEF